MAKRATVIRQRRTLVLLAVSHRTLAGAIEDALTHYWIGCRTAETLPWAVDWSHVCQRMAQALEAVQPEDDEGEARE